MYIETRVVTAQAVSLCNYPYAILSELTGTQYEILDYFMTPEW